MVLLVIVVSCGASLAFTLRQSPVYEATAQVLLQGRPSEQVLQGGDQALLAQNRGGQTEVEVMRSQSVRSAVAKQLGHTPKVVITQIPTTSVVDVTAQAGNPTTATQDANTYAKVYSDNRKQELVDDLLSASTQLQARIADLDTQIAAVQRPLTDLGNQLANTTKPDARLSLQSRLDSLQSEVAGRQSSVNARRTAYANQLDQLQLAVNSTVTGGAQVVSAATEPSAPVSPHPARTGAIALGIGTVLGIGLAFIFDQLDDRIRSKEQLEALTGLPNLGLLPSVRSWRRAATPNVILETANSAAAEAYRSLRTAVQFIGIESPGQVIHVTSASAADGKTTSVVNLGAALAQAGKRVIIVDADLRRPKISRVFGIEGDLGLTNVLLGEGDLADSVVPVKDHPQLAVLSSGPVPPNPSEMLGLRRFAKLIATLRAESDYVLIDSPPVLPVADAQIVSAVAEVTLLVVKADKSAEKDVRRAIELLRQVDASLVGTIFNNIHKHHGYRSRYGYGYRYGYGTHDEKRRPWRWRRQRASPPSTPELEPGGDRALTGS